MKLAFNWDIVPCYDVIATIRGSQYPDEWVVRGNHHDAWVNGANDPVSGIAAVLEEAKSIGEMLKTGWHPKRTLVYCAWDGEEPALLGSTEWVEDHLKELQQKAVVYINSDDNARGFLGAGGSHALQQMVNEVAATVTDPQTGVSVLKRKLAKEAADAPTVKAKRDALNKKEMELSALVRGLTLRLSCNMPVFLPLILVLVAKMAVVNTIPFMIRMIITVASKIPLSGMVWHSRKQQGI